MSRKARLRKAVEPLLSDPVSWGFGDRLVYRTPVDWFLLGILAEVSSRQGRFYLWVVSMPLFVPGNHLVLDHGWRVPSGVTTLSFDEPDSLRGALELAVAQVPSRQEALSAVAKSTNEEGPYARVLSGDGRAAESELELPYYPDDQRTFVEESRGRRAEVLAALRAGGSGAAEQLLGTWRNQTVHALGLAGTDPETRS